MRALLVLVLAWLAAGLATGAALFAWSTLRAPEGGISGLPQSTLMLASAVGYGPALLVIAWAWRTLDRLPLSGLGYVPPARRALRGVARGAALGVALMGVVVGIGWALGGYGFAVGDLASTARAQLAWVPVLAVAAHFEEVLFRGYLLQNLGRGRVALGIGLSSLLFGAVHLQNPNADGGGIALGILLFLNIVLAGVWLATLYLRHGDLWWATGAHLGWNWAQGLLFGLPVSGLELPGLLRGWVTGRWPLVVGGAFGPESSLLATALLGGLVVEGLLAVRRAGSRLPLETAWAAREPVPGEVEVT